VGLLAVAVHLVSIPLPMFIGYQAVPPLGASLAISQLLVGGWLIAKGFTPSEV
jgi:hypothetical protein